MKKYCFYLIILLFLQNIIYAKVRIMPLGDSLTYDDSYADYSGTSRPSSLRHGYRNYLWYKLRDAKYSVDFVGSVIAGEEITPYFDPENEGYPGETSDFIANIIYNKLIEYPADIILLHIGTNDRLKIDDSGNYMHGVKKIFSEIDRYEHNFNNPIQVVVAKIIGRRHNDYDSFTSRFNQNLKDIVNNRILNGDKLILIDMQHDAHLDYSKDFQDPAHPNNTGYDKMATLWFDSLKNILPTSAGPNPLLRPFVERFYTTILERNGEEAGISYWTEKLADQDYAASDLARGFIFSDEFENKNSDDETYLNILYHAFFDREPDEAGLIYWQTKLSDNINRFTVLNGFLYSTEFLHLTQSYNILNVNPYELFISRFYTKALQRDAEAEGLSYWVTQLQTYQASASSIAKSFFNSDEFKEKETSNSEYVTLLYQTLLNREPDSTGLNTWMEKLVLGISRDTILDSFIHSEEFKILAKNYGIRL